MIVISLNLFSTDPHLVCFQHLVKNLLQNMFSVSVFNENYHCIHLKYLVSNVL